MNELPIRAGDTVTDPQLFEISRRRWPGHAISSEMLADAARLEGRPLYIPASPEIVAAGLAEIEKDRRMSVARNQTAAGYRRMGFDPTKSYTKE